MGGGQVATMTSKPPVIDWDGGWGLRGLFVNFQQLRTDELREKHLDKFVTQAEHLIDKAKVEGATEELEYLINNLVDGQTHHPAAPHHNNYILKVDVVADRLTQLKDQLNAKGE